MQYAIGRSREQAQRPLVSCVIIFLNEERFLDEAIRSVIAQSYDAWELMLVDDGSTDRSSDIARRYAAEHPGRVRYLEHPGHENRGMSASRNLGFQHATGSFIALLDGDDVWLPNKLIDQVAILSAHPEAAMVYGRTRFWHGWTGTPEHRRRDWWTPLGVEPNQVVAPPKLVTNFLQNENTVVSNCSVLVRKEVIQAVGGWENSFRTMHEDMVLWTKVLSQWPAFVSDGTWDLYRQHPGNSSILAAAEGVYNPFGPNDFRRRFLEWMRAYLEQGGITDAALLTTLARQLEPYDGPPGRRLSWRATSLLRRLGVAGRLLAERILGSPLSQHVRTSRAVNRLLGPASEYLPPVGYVQFGGLRRLEPVGVDNNRDRDVPVDRHYIERFIGQHTGDIRGRVLEFGSDTFTRAFGGRRCTSVEVRGASNGNAGSPNASDVTSDDDVPDVYDCIICTVLSGVYDVRTAVSTLLRRLKPGGVLLASLQGVAGSRQAASEPSGDFWRFTVHSARLLFEECFPAANLDVSSQGNVFAAVVLLERVATQHIDTTRLEPQDPHYPLVVNVRAVKPGAP